MRRPLAFVCVALLAIAMCVPAAADLFAGVLTPVWLLFAPTLTVAVVVRVERCSEQVRPLFSSDGFRGPPRLTTLS